MDKNLNYIEDHYIEWEEIIKATNISSEKLKQLIDDKLIPNASYNIDSEITITSPLNDSFKIIVSKQYFAKNIIDLIHNNQTETYEKLRGEFKEKLLFNLKNHDYKEFAYGNILNENDEIDLKKADKIFDEEWDYFCKGVYGICTLNNNENAVIEKEIVIKRILNFIEQKSSILRNEEKILLKELNDELNKSTSNFAPYQRELSSRGKYLDKLLREFSLDDLIKKYD
ncbi:hypothetical protein EYY60_17445 [Flavobacterium zhairuonense]|uniref:DUF6058 family natural product biosynthesis protein n=1 Tax=Flavobacterium zhairuonense TaxID=2493631 RepID=UPI0010481801|nr:DUF6058 family natural product biosynthesis protein [Flavobacterium zhairuonense]KAF2507737.1 hypothetical protein EYY60_17445 [Flavobacterium zhairuonense]